MSAEITGPFEAKVHINPICRTSAAIYGPDGDIIALVFDNLGLDWKAIDVARLLAASPFLAEAVKASPCECRWRPIAGCADRQIIKCMRCEALEKTGIR